MTNGHTRLGPRPTNVRWMVFGLGCGTSWMLYLHRYTFALIKPELPWNPIQLSLLDSSFRIAYVLPTGALANAVGPRWFLGVSILLWSAALGLHALAPDLAWMRAARASFGAAQAGAYAALNGITRSWFPASIRTSIQGWIGVFFGRIGGASANLLFATFLIGVLHLGWREAIYVFMAAGLVLGAAFLVLFRDSPRQHPLANEAEARLIEGAGPSEPLPPRLSVRELLRRVSGRSAFNLAALNVQTSLSAVADDIYLSWVPLFLFQVHDLKFKEMGIYSALPLLGGACGGAVGGYLNDGLIFLTGNRRWSRTAVGLAGKGTAGLLLIASLAFYNNPYHFCWMLFVVKFFGDWSLAATWGSVTDMSGRASATVFAFNNSVAGVVAIFAPTLFGAVAHFYGWRVAFVVVAVLYGLCAASWLLVNCTIPVLADRSTSTRDAPVERG